MNMRGRTVRIFDRMSAQIAYLMAVYRHRPQTVAALERMVEAYAEAGASEMGADVRNTRIVGARNSSAKSASATKCASTGRRYSKRHRLRRGAYRRGCQGL